MSQRTHSSEQVDSEFRTTGGQVNQGRASRGVKRVLARCSEGGADQPPESPGWTNAPKRELREQRLSWKTLASNTTLSRDRHLGPLCPMLGLETTQIVALSILCMELPFDIGFNTQVETSS